MPGPLKLSMRNPLQGQGGEGPGASPMRQALDRLAQRAWTHRRGTPDPSRGTFEPGLHRTSSSPSSSPTHSRSPRPSQALLDPHSPIANPSASTRRATASFADHSYARPSQLAGQRGDFSGDYVRGSLLGQGNRSFTGAAFGQAHSSRHSATSRDTSVPLRTAASDLTMTLPVTSASASGQASTALVPRAENSAELSLAESEAAQAPRAEHQLRTKVSHALLLYGC